MSGQSQIAELETKINAITSNPRYLQSKRARNKTERDRFERYTRELTVLKNKLQTLTPVTKTTMQMNYDAQKPHHKPPPKAELPVSSKKPSWRNQPKKVAWRNQGDGLAARHDDVRDEDWERSYAEKFGDPKKTGTVDLPSNTGHRRRTGRSTLNDPSLARTVPIERTPVTRDELLDARRIRAKKSARVQNDVTNRKNVAPGPPNQTPVTKSTPGVPLVTEPKAQPAQNRMRNGRRANRRPKPKTVIVTHKPRVVAAPRPSFGTENLDELESLDSLEDLEDLSDNMDSGGDGEGVSPGGDAAPQSDAESFSFSEE